MKMFLLSIALIAASGGAQTVSGKAIVMHHAAGTFEVKMKPEPLSEVAGKTGIQRMSIDKTFHGQLEAVSQGEFLASGSPDGSGAYSAIERVAGTLDGRSGAFVLQHTGVMDRGTPEMSVKVVPGSGSGELTGLTGTMTITVTDGKHHYDFAYAL